MCNNTRTGIQTHTHSARKKKKKGADRMVSIMELFHPLQFSLGWMTYRKEKKIQDTARYTHKRQHLTCWRRLSLSLSRVLFSLFSLLYSLTKKRQCLLELVLAPVRGHSFLSLFFFFHSFFLSFFLTCGSVWLLLVTPTNSWTQSRHGDHQPPIAHSNRLLLFVFLQNLLSVSFLFL